MRKIHCLNAISKYGTDLLNDNYALTGEIQEADGILVRSASMHEMEFSDSLLAIARAGAGVNNIPLDACAEKGIVVFNTPGANANGVKELVLAGLLLASRDVIGGIGWCKDNKDDANIAKTTEKSKRHLQAVKSRARSWASLAWEPLAFWLRMRQQDWAWRFMDMTHIFPFTLPGCFLVK